MPLPKLGLFWLSLFLVIWLTFNLTTPAKAQSPTLPIVAQLTLPLTATHISSATVARPLTFSLALSTTLPLTFTPPLTSLNVSLSTTQRLLYLDQPRQRMYLYENGQPVRTLLVSTGTPTSRTLTKAWQGNVGKYMGAVSVIGGFKVDYSWYLYPDFYGNILIHSVPYTQVGELKYYDRPDALGLEPTSHGCIRISDEDATWLKSWNPISATIQITPWRGEIK